MQILNINGDNIKACCQFQYKGYTVSISTIFNDPVIAFNESSELVSDTVEKVINLIDFKQEN